MTLDQIIGLNLKELRKGAGLSQTNLLKALRSSYGIKWDRVKMTAIENGKGRPINPEELAQVAEHFGIHPVTFLLPPTSAMEEKIGSKMGWEYLLEVRDALQARVAEVLSEYLRKDPKSDAVKKLYEVIG